MPHAACFQLGSTLKANPSQHRRLPAAFNYACVPPWRSGHVFKALLRGELVAAKRIDLVQSPDSLEAFLTGGDNI